MLVIRVANKTILVVIDVDLGICNPCADIYHVFRRALPAYSLMGIGTRCAGECD
jgi:hypothetical protein